MTEGERTAQVPAFEQEAPQTAARFPHIISRLRGLWQDAPACRRFLDSLLVDDRGQSEGFPAPILLEIMHLNELFEAARGAQPASDVWTQNEPML